MEDTRNVIDQYKHWTNEAIKQDLQANSFPFAVLMEQLNGDFNIGTLIRNANAFGAIEVFYYGPRKHYDRRGAQGAYHYTMVNYLKTMGELLVLKEKYTVVGFDNIPGSVPVETFSYPKDKKVLLVFGEEGRGISPEVLSICDHLVSITQYGSIRSLNVGTASGIAMFDFVNKIK